MSEPPAQGGEWRPIADQIAVNVKNFIDGVEALARGGGDETVPMLLLEVSQILLAGAQLGASRDVILPGNWEPEVGADRIWTRYAPAWPRGSPRSTSTPRCSTRTRTRRACRSGFPTT